MTNRNEATESSESNDNSSGNNDCGENGEYGDIAASGYIGERGEGGDADGDEAGRVAPRGGPVGRAQRPPYDAAALTAYEGHVPYAPRPTYDDGGPTAHRVTLRTPAELADALPYLLGYRPEDSIVLVALNDLGGRGRFGGRARLGIPAAPDDWPAVARQLAQGLVTGSERRGVRPAQMVAYLCQEPRDGETGRQVMQRLKPLAQLLRVACGDLDVPVIEALCIADGRFWSYCCSLPGCCPAEGAPMGLPGTSVLAAAATYAGIQVRGTLRELRSRLVPLEISTVPDQEAALDRAGAAMVPRIIRDGSRDAVAEETLTLATRLIRRFTDVPVVSAAHLADRADDALLSSDEAASLILGLQDRETRDRAAAWMEGPDAPPALRLWRALARRCVGSYGEHAAAPLTLAGWVAWSSGDELEAREALAMALGADPDYLFARLLHQACNEGLDPESVRRCLRAGRGRDASSTSVAGEEADTGVTRETDVEAEHPATDTPPTLIPAPVPAPDVAPEPLAGPASTRASASASASVSVTGRTSAGTSDRRRRRSTRRDAPPGYPGPTRPPVRARKDRVGHDDVEEPR
ncbi:DUF4192 domain-containing protein [Streptomyces sp. NPDC086091]|uniref:DUF4192 domain-containing protein n=1 Tax=Streptomyces sp. NPDC086091 TaxID=3365751 RepID=UPI003822E33F